MIICGWNLMRMRSRPQRCSSQAGAALVKPIHRDPITSFYRPESPGLNTPAPLGNCGGHAGVPSSFPKRWSYNQAMASSGNRLEAHETISDSKSVFSHHFVADLLEHKLENAVYYITIVKFYNQY